MSVLVTGGAGYIGSHTVLALLERGEEVVVLDNFANSSEIALDRVSELMNRDLIFYQGDVQDSQVLQRIFDDQHITAVIHFAGLKAVGKSSRLPLEYYQVNVNGTMVLLDEMRRAGVHQLIFSSSATVYGVNSPVPFVETTPIGGTVSPYGTSKLMVEQIWADFAQAEPQFAIIALRYFNPVGAHDSGHIGEDPNGTPNNLLPFIAQVAVGRQPKLNIFGDDYPTKDGTCVRDYIHVMDVAEGHLNAMDNLPAQQGYRAYNLGAGVGYSILDMVREFEKTSGKTISYEIIPRRQGDLAAFWVDAHLAEKALGWCAKRSLDTMLRDTLNWQRANPNGYTR